VPSRLHTRQSNGRPPVSLLTSLRSRRTPFCCFCTVGTLENPLPYALPSGNRLPHSNQCRNYDIATNSIRAWQVHLPSLSPSISRGFTCGASACCATSTRHMWLCNYTRHHPSTNSPSPAHEMHETTSDGQISPRFTCLREASSHPARIGLLKTAIWNLAEASLDPRVTCIRRLCCKVRRLKNHPFSKSPLQLAVFVRKLWT
jgi:hypothetical protein